MSSQSVNTGDQNRDTSNGAFPEDLTKHDKTCLVYGYGREQSTTDIPDAILKLFIIIMNNHHIGELIKNY